MSSCATHAIDIRDLRYLSEIIRRCFETPSKRCCITTFLRELLDRSRIRNIGLRRVNICISDPNDIRCDNAEKCLRELLCRKDRQEIERCPDLVILYGSACGYVEVKNHISTKNATRLLKILEDAEDKFLSKCASELGDILGRSCKKIVFVNIGLPRSVRNTFKERFVVIEEDPDLIIDKLRDF